MGVRECVMLREVRELQELQELRELREVREVRVIHTTDDVVTYLYIRNNNAEI